MTEGPAWVAGNAYAEGGVREVVTGVVLKGVVLACSNRGIQPKFGGILKQQCASQANAREAYPTNVSKRWLVKSSQP